MNNNVVIDLETTAHTTFKRKANPFDSKNRIVCAAVKESTTEPYVLKDHELDKLQNILQNNKLWVNHNIKFDLLYVWHLDFVQEWLQDGGRVWDTQLVEYILTGQEAQFSSLNELSEKYGGTQKNIDVSESFEEGLGADQIPEDILHAYAIEDALNTEKVYLAQLREVEARGIEKLIQVHNLYVLSTVEMEFNGMPIDTARAPIIRDMLQAQLKDLDQYLPERLRGNFNWDSNDNISALLFGGQITWREIKERKVRKTGQKIGTEYFRYNHLLEKLPRILTPRSDWKTSKEGTWSTSEKVLEQLDLHVCKDILHNRKINKQINTYIDAIPELVQEDGRVHHSLHHTKTATGRLSSSNPNLQNIPRGNSSDVKELFVSQWGNEGYLIECDAAQLEVCCAAQVYQCDTLIQDIINKLDFHKQTASFSLNKPMTDITAEERTLAKAGTFCVFYGAWKEKVAQQMGVSEEQAENYINSFYDKYSGVKNGQNSHIQAVKRSRKPYKFKEGVTGKGKLITPYGRVFTFEERDWYLNDRPSFKSPQIKDYPIQGLAGDILATITGILFTRLLHHRSKIRIINTVHDSIIFDCHQDFVQESLTIVLNCLHCTVDYLETELRIQAVVPFKWEIKIGRNWKDMKEVKSLG